MMLILTESPTFATPRFSVRPSPTVDRLVGIAGNGKIAMVNRQHPGNGVLHGVRVLIFVNENVAKSVIQNLSHFGILFEQHGNVQEQVVEINRIGTAEFILVERIKFAVDGQNLL